MSIASQLSFSTATSVLAGTAGALLYQSAANTTAFLTIGTNGYVLTSNGSVPGWSLASGITSGASTQVQTAIATTSANYFPTFVDSNNLTATAETVYTTSTFTINPLTGVVGIGGSDSGSPLTVKALSTLTGAINSFQKIFTTQASGGLGNNVYVSEWRRRRAAGTDWTTQNVHNGIWVDASFTTPGTDTRTWWDRDPGTTSQAWGDQATTWMFVNSTGLGVGTTSPGERLDIQSLGDLKARIYTTGATTSTHSGLTLKTGSYEYLIQNFTSNAGSAGALRFYDITAATERMRIDSSGNVGIGVTPSAVNQGRSIELLAPGMGLWNGTGSPSSIYVTGNAYWNSGFKYGVSSQASHYYQYQGQHVWSTAPSGTAGNAISFTQAMTLDASGNVGIGTTSFSARFTANSDNSTAYANTAPNIANCTAAFINGSAHTSGGTFVGYQLNISGNSQNRIGYIGAVSESTSNQGLSLVFGTNTTAGDRSEKMRLDSAGNLGFGVTPSAWATYKSFDLGQFGYISSGAGGWMELMDNTYWNGAYRYKGTGAASHYLQQGGQHTWFTAFSGTAGNAISFTQAMTLTVNGGLSFNGSTNYGTAGQILQSNGDAAPTWVPVSSTTVGTSTQVQTVLQTANATYYPTFVDSNNASATAELVYTTSSFTINAMTGNVGIGTTSPGAKFTINNAGSTSAAFYADIGNPGSPITLFEHTGASSPVPFRFRKSGFSGAAPNYGLFYLHMNDGTIGNGSNLYFNLNNSSGTEIEYGGLGAIIRSNTAASEQGDLALYVMHNGTGRTERLRITSTGNVGIGTSSPVSALHVAGAGFGATTTVRIDSTSTSNSGPPSLILTRSSSAVMAGQGIGNIYFSRLLTDASSNTAASIIATGNNSSSAPTCTINYDAITAQVWKINSTEAARIDSSGNVGIGTSSPSAKLDVSGGSIRVNEDGVGTKIITIRSNFASLGPAINVTTNDPLLFLTNNTERMRIDSSGNVGIGTSSPGYKLEVNGAFAATTKSFVINHPTKPGMKLRYGSLEGPENGIYIRGKLTGANTIDLPEYWTKLVDPDSITVSLTSIGKHQDLYVADIANNVVTVGNGNLLSKAINCFYVVYGERCDVDKLVVEI